MITQRKSCLIRGVKKLFEFENFVIIGFTDHDTAVTAKTGLLELADALVHLGQVSLDIFTRAPQETRRVVSRYLETQWGDSETDF